MPKLALLTAVDGPIELAEFPADNAGAWHRGTFANERPRR